MKQYTLTDWEIENGYIQDGKFYRPACAIMRNGEFMECDSYVSSYPYAITYQILHHLQAVSSDKFSIGIYSYIPTALAQIANTPAFDNLLDDPFIKGGKHD